MTNKKAPIFYCIESGIDPSARLLEKSCEKKRVCFETIDPLYFDFSTKHIIKENSLLYRSSRKNEAKIIVRILLDESTATFYSSYQRAFNSIASLSIHLKENVPMPKTILSVQNDKKLLRKYVRYLGGFPLIVKVMGKSHGIGVLKIDSFSSFLSVTDYLFSTKSRFILREFIETRTSARLIVLGNKVVDSIEYIAPRDDFRSNEGVKPKTRAKIYSNEIQKVATKAVAVLGWEFGGVDILIDKKGNPLVIEVNFPCFFARSQNKTGTDISGMMIDYLIKKQQAFSN